MPRAYRQAIGRAKALQEGRFDEEIAQQAAEDESSPEN